MKSARSNGQYKAQTIPTRTPIPPPATATKSNGGNNNPTATNTPQTQASPTSTLLSVTFAPTPVGGFIATAVPCSSNPTIQTLGATNVRSGPNIEYEVVGELVYLEVRHIVGRAETAAWWLIQFNDGQSGWVADEIVLVQGYTPIIPIVAAPPLAGGTPTPASAWNPTPIPFCTVTPVPTAVPSPTPTAEPVEVSPVEVSSTETPLPTEPPPTEVRPTETAIVQPTAVPINPTVPLATAVSTPPEEDGNSSIGIILLAIGLLGVGALVLFFLRRR
ncbi:MAG: SH3 domain-containing protein [Chloroflexi bacterium]|nr:SH3 domain-containing protein [Chloroflexota bacterium]